ncbi:MAG: radical SAM protein [Myxococcales bacterium]|nr:radical SAM protein [Myxococcales bacterium]
MSSIATFDLTTRCPLRCRHCYVAADSLTDLDDEPYVARLTELRDEHGIRSAFWLGGEPLLRVELLRRAIRLFARNAVVTSAAVVVPADLQAGVLVSVDGPRRSHDHLRGRGSYDRVLRNVAALPRRSFVLSTTLTSETLEAVERLDEIVEETGAAAVLVGFHVGRPGDPLNVTGARRDRTIDRLCELSSRRPQLIANTVAGLQRLRPRAAADTAVNCIYRGGATAFDAQLQPKVPCTFGEHAGCQQCGCAVVAEQRARALGNVESLQVLNRLFPRCTELDARGRALRTSSRRRCSR